MVNETFNPSVYPRMTDKNSTLQIVFAHATGTKKGLL